jgi:hypothetical protein
MSARAAFNEQTDRRTCRRRATAALGGDVARVGGWKTKRRGTDGGGLDVRFARDAAILMVRWFTAGRRALSIVRSQSIAAFRSGTWAGS